MSSSPGASTQGRLHVRIPESLYAWALFLFSLALYAWSSPRTLAFEDDGLFVMASYFNDAAHPPGYPLLTLLGHLATFLPFGSVAYRVHMVSALFGALSCVMLYKIAMHIFRDRTYAVIAGACLAVSREFWSQAIISEVYTLNVFIVLVLILFSLQLAEDDRPFSRRKLYLMALLYGLGLSNHWPLLILTSPAMALILWPVRREVFGALLRCIPFLLLGLTPYLWLVIRSHMHPVISFYGAIDNWREFWYMVSRKGYAETDVNLGANMWDRLHFVLFVLRETAVQLSPLGLVFVAVGFVRQWRVWTPWFCLALLAGYLGSTFLLIGLLGFNYDVLHQNVFRVYPVNAYTLMILWLCLGIQYVAGLLVRVARSHVSTANAVRLLGILTVCVAFLTNLPYNYRARDHLAQEYAHVVFNTLAPDSDFFTIADVDTFVLGYFHLVEGIRPDVTLYHSLGLVFDTRLFPPMTTGTGERHRILSKFIEHETRPVYYISDLPKIYGYKYYGPYSRLDKDLPPNEGQLVIDSRIINFYERLLDSGASFDHWERMVQGVMITDYCKLVTLISDEDWHAHRQEALRVCQGYGSLMVLIDFLLKQKSPDQVLVERLLQQAHGLRHRANTASDYITWDVLYARLLLLQGRIPGALRHLHAAVQEWPDPANPAYALLREHEPAAGAKPRPAPPGGA